MQKESVIEIMRDIRNLLLHNKEIFNIEELCSYTGFEKSYIYKLCSLKKIPHSKPLGKLFFNKAKIIVWLQRNSVKTQEEIIEQANIISNFKKSK